MTLTTDKLCEIMRGVDRGEMPSKEDVTEIVHMILAESYPSRTWHILGEMIQAGVEKILARECGNADRVQECERYDALLRPQLPIEIREAIEA